MRAFENRFENGSSLSRSLSEHQEAIPCTLSPLCIIIIFAGMQFNRSSPLISLLFLEARAPLCLQIGACPKNAILTNGSRRLFALAITGGLFRRLLVCRWRHAQHMILQNPAPHIRHSARLVLHFVIATICWLIEMATSHPASQPAGERTVSISDLRSRVVSSFHHQTLGVAGVLAATGRQRAV